jgi:hypothetical protein
MENDDGASRPSDAGEAAPVFEPGPLTPTPEVAELLGIGQAGQLNDAHVADALLYDLPTPIGITLNARTAQALDTWFGQRQPVPGGGGGVEDETGHDTTAAGWDQIQWVLGVATLVLFLVVLVAGMAGVPDEAGFWLGGGAMATGSVSVLAHHAAKRRRQEHEDAVKQRDQVARARMREVQGTPGPPELKLSLQAAQVAHDIESSPAFSSGYLSNHRRRINLGEEVVQLAADAVELWKVRATLTPRESIADAGESEALLAVLDAHDRDLVEVWESLVRRAHALDRYLEKVREMSTRLRYLEQLESAADQSGRIASLKLRTIEHHQAADATDVMSSELTAVREAIDQLVRGLDKEAAIIEHRQPPTPQDEGADEL